ncbi:hypothetical protein [Thiothrix sp.]|uniref:hypothetical protein n=1 Tax=Thiothrix sp. TaxID=1032 RepID=UPI00257CC457|nr:hypothetical protein [Thiothrix sp.]
MKNFNGAHIGEVEGKAIFKSKNEATFTSEKHEDWFNNECVINFIRTNDIMQITENSCSYYHGMSSHFDGYYSLKKDAFYDLNIFDDLLLSNVYALLQTEENWRIFSEDFNNIYINDKNEAFKGRIITGGAAGLYGIYEAILMISPSNEVWGAYLYEEKVYFFTNSIKSIIPQEILRWGGNFRDIELIVLTKI